MKRWLLAVVLAGCVDAKYKMDCSNLLSPDQATYRAVVALVVTPNRKACSTCHTVDTPIDGYDFEGTGVAYDALTTKMEYIYPQIVAHRMPQPDPMLAPDDPNQPLPWTDDDIKVLRSWYCYGMDYNP